MNLDYKEELTAIRSNLHKKGSSKVNISKLKLLKEKSVGSLSEEEKDFLKNIRGKK